MAGLWAFWRSYGQSLSLTVLVLVVRALPVNPSPLTPSSGSEPLPVQAEEISRTTPLFARGRWILAGYGSGTAGKSSRNVYAAHFGLGYHVIDNLSLNLEATGYFIKQAKDTGGVGLDIVPRWHFLRGDRWSLYLDGGAGVMYTEGPLRSPGTKFNFALQGGLGMSYNFTERLIPVVGLRWFHISNARIQGEDRNVGFDAPMIYFGFIAPY